VSYFNLFILTALVTAQMAFANPLQNLLSAVNLDRAEIDGVEVVPAEDGKFITVRIPPTDSPLGLSIPVPAGAMDWSEVGTFSFFAESDSTIRFNLRIRNSAGATFQYSIHPFLNVPVRVAIPGRFLQKEYMNSQQFGGYWISNWDNHIDLTSVEAIEIRMRTDRPVTLRLGEFALHDGAVEDAILRDGPFVDKFGQWIDAEWPGKVDSLEDLQTAWQKEDAALAEVQDFGYSQFGGWKERKVEGSGFFRVEEIDGRWWFVDPEGYLFFSTGMNCVRQRAPTRVVGREKMFEVVPPIVGNDSDFYQANADLRYREEGYFETFIPTQNDRLRNWGFTENWRRKQNQRLTSWGFNTVGNWSNRSLWWDPDLPFVVNLAFNQEGKNWQKFPDVYSEAFARQVEADAQRQCTRFRNEPLLIGYFAGNEERWPNRNFIDLILNDPEPTATQDHVVAYLKQNGDNAATREQLTEKLARKYFKTVSDAIRRADPNHLVLGIRWAGGHAPDPVMRANDVFDVFSLNLYWFRPQPEDIQRLHDLSGLPIIIGEFHFGAAGRGYAPSLVRVKDQEQRGVAYQYYVEQAASLPMVVGTHYFQHLDQAVTGRYDGENYLFGFVNQQDIPYPLMVDAARTTHRRVYSIHAGQTAPTQTRAIVK
jgi:hypothetical protein